MLYDSSIEREKYASNRLILPTTKTETMSHQFLGVWQKERRRIVENVFDRASTKHSETVSTVHSHIELTAT